MPWADFSDIGAMVGDRARIFPALLKISHPVIRAVQLWGRADGLRMSAAMSFYGVLSLAPLLVLVLLVAASCARVLAEEAQTGTTQRGDKGEKNLTPATATAVHT